LRWKRVDVNREAIWCRVGPELERVDMCAWNWAFGELVTDLANFPSFWPTRRGVCILWGLRRVMERWNGRLREGTGVGGPPPSRPEWLQDWFEVYGAFGHLAVVESVTGPRGTMVYSELTQLGHMPPRSMGDGPPPAIGTPYVWHWAIARPAAIGGAFGRPGCTGVHRRLRFIHPVANLAQAR